MKVERFEQAHDLADGQLVTDANGQLWEVRHGSGQHHTVLSSVGADEQAVIIKAAGETHVYGDEAPLPWQTVKVVPDEPVPLYCVRCGASTWAEAPVKVVPEPAGDHLQVVTSDRGFARLPAIPSEYGGSVRVYESSAAMGPHLWLTAEAPASLNEPDGPHVEAPIHLTVENAIKLSEQIQLLCRNHYQREPLMHLSTMCGGCGDNQQLAKGIGTFVPHTNRHTGRPCSGDPVRVTAAEFAAALLNKLQPAGSNCSTMCVCGDMQAGAADPLAALNAFAPHVDRKTGQPCPGIPLPGWPAS